MLNWYSRTIPYYEIFQQFLQLICNEQGILMCHRITKVFHFLLKIFQIQEVEVPNADLQKTCIKYVCLTWNFFFFLKKNELNLELLSTHIEYQQICFLIFYACLRASQLALVVKNPPASDRDVKDIGSIPGSGRFSGGGHGNPLQCSFMENPTDRGAWWATVHRVAKSQIRLKQLSTHACLSSGRNPTLIIWLTQKILAVFNGEVIKTVVQVKLLLNPSRENPQTE